MRENLTGTKKIPHPELVEGRASVIPVACKQLIQLANLCEEAGVTTGAGVDGAHPAAGAPRLRLIRDVKNIEPVLCAPADQNKGNQGRPARAGERPLRPA
jgi:hypothetical protein